MATTNKINIIILFIFYLLINNELVALDYSKYSASLKNYLLTNDTNNYYNNIRDLQVPNMVSCFLKVDKSADLSQLIEYGVIINTITDDVLSVSIPIDVLGEVSSLNYIHRIEMATSLDWACDSVKVFVGADKLISGLNKKQTKLTGKGVIIGVIDSGIDFYHKEFRDINDTTKSKILYIWDQTDNSGTKPNNYIYGTEYTKLDIENELDGSPQNYVKQDDKAEGHGTHVASIAAGNRGIAPEADIIFVKLNFSALDVSTAVLDATNYILKKAEELNRPAVINGSFGWIYNIPHDGSDLLSQGLNNIISQKTGRAFCASAGNKGSYKNHWGNYNLNNDSVWIYAFSSSYYFNINKQFIDSLFFTIEADSISYTYDTIKYINRTMPFCLNDVLNNNGQKIYLISNDDIDNTNDTLACFTLTASEIGNSNYEMIINIKYIYSKKNIYKIIVHGNGIFHSWGSNYISSTRLYFGGLPIDSNYLKPDNHYMIGTPALADKVISVGACTNVHTYTSVKNSELPSEKYRSAPGTYCSYSSPGPRTDGIIKPDIIAPGRYVSAAKCSETKFDSTYLVEDGTYVVGNGTSMSAPVVAGCIALLFENNPNLYYSEIIDLIKKYAISDDCSSCYEPLPNKYCGWGRININTIFENENFEPITEEISVYPNPANNYITLNIVSNSVCNTYAKISNIIGNIVLNQNIILNKGNNCVYLPINLLSSGVYIATINLSNGIFYNSFIKE